MAFKALRSPTVGSEQYYYELRHQYAKLTDYLYLCSHNAVQQTHKLRRIKPTAEVSPCMVQLLPSSSIPTGGVVPLIEGKLSHLLPRWLRMGWQRVISQISQGKILCNASPQTVGNLTRAMERTVRCVQSLSYHDPGHGEDSEMHSVTELSWPGPRRGQWDAFSHWAIMTRAMGRTVRCIQSLSYHDPAHGEDSDMHSVTELSWIDGTDDEVLIVPENWRGLGKAFIQKQKDHGLKIRVVQIEILNIDPSIP